MSKPIKESAKVGTRPTTIIRDRRTPLKVGARIRFRDPAPNTRWRLARVEVTEPYLKITPI